MPAAPLPTSSPVWHTARDLLYTCSMLPPATSAPVPEPAQPPSVETPAPTEMPEDQALMRAEDATGPTARTYALVAVSHAARVRYRRRPAAVACTHLHPRAELHRTGSVSATLRTVA